MQIDPSKMPLHPEEIYDHQRKPALVREFTLGLPDGFSLFYFTRVALKYDDLDVHVHGPLCHFLEYPQYGRFRDATVPRSWFKTSVATVAKNIWLPIKRDQNIKILIAMNTADNAEKRVNLIKNHWQTNTLLQQAFPELVPDFKHCRWSNSCAELRRTKRSEEGTYEAIGSGGAVISRHYNHITEDDLVYARKDDFSNTELAPSQEDIDKAIGWHKLVYSLFSNPQESTLDNIGTRWAPHDLKDWIRRHEYAKYKFFKIDAEKKDAQGNFMGTDHPVWPRRFGTPALEDIKASQGPYMYATQYLNCPRDPSDIVFEPQWISWYSTDAYLPNNLNLLTVVDLALWGDTNGKARNVILTLGMDSKHHIWVVRYDRGKFNPTEVIHLMEAHAKAYPGTRVRVEEIQYQRAIRHFAKKRMEDTGFMYDIGQIPHDGRTNAKDLRIRNIVNVACNGALHVKPIMKDLYNEYCEYPDKGTTRDILDCIGHGLRILQPTAIQKVETSNENNPFLLDNIIKELEANYRGAGAGLPFDLQRSRQGGVDVRTHL